QRVAPYAAPNYGPGYRPQLSPYLNLVPFNDPARPAVNYYLGTLPEFQRRSNAVLFQSEIRALENRPPVVAGSPEEQDLFRRSRARLRRRASAARPASVEPSNPVSRPAGSGEVLGGAVAVCGTKPCNAVWPGKTGGFTVAQKVWLEVEDAGVVVCGRRMAVI